MHLGIGANFTSIFGASQQSDDASVSFKAYSGALWRDLNGFRGLRLGSLQVRARDLQWPYKRIRGYTKVCANQGL